MFAVAAILALTACQESVTLLGKDNAVLGNGTIEPNGAVHVLLSGKEFSGIWKSTDIYDEETAKRHRLAGTRSYEAYMLGNTPDQLRHGHAVLTAQDGTEVICDVLYHGQPRLGNCIIDGESLELVIKQSSEAQESGKP